MAKSCSHSQPRKWYGFFGILFEHLTGRQADTVTQVSLSFLHQFHAPVPPYSYLLNPSLKLKNVVIDSVL